MGIFSRLDRERRTMAAMLGMYCRHHHRPERGLCDECRELSDYAGYRLSRCPWGDAKPTCAECTIHCYEVQRREQVRRVMRYAGPRMLLRHPLLAICHVFDRRRGSAAQRRSDNGG